jgi:uncharacterized membrane protein YfcA
MIGAWLLGALGLAGIVAGGLAAVAGFGIGSVLTPVLALETGTRLAVAAVAIPHVIGTAQRFWLLRAHVDRRVLLGFGVASAAGGLLGALLQSVASGRGLTIVFGLALMATGIAELTGWMRRVRWGRRAAWVAGLVSGLLGGLVGNQGSVRSASLLGFDVPKESFVATATAIALCVDAARLPIYLATQGPEIAALWPQLLVATGGVIVGTAVGTRVLGRIDEATFHRTLGIGLIGLGAWLAATAA